jgi:uncharacterized protein YjbI with pentapeptide repeats
MDSCTGRVILPALLGIIGSILSGCLGGVLGYALPIHREWLKRSMSSRGGEPQQMRGLALGSRLEARQGFGRVELRPEANLRAVDLAGRYLEAVDLSRANIEGANLQRAVLQRGNLTRANLSGSNLWGANLLGADLRRADLRYANLRGAALDGANLLYANLRGAVLFRASLRGANLEWADLSGANLSQADLRWAKIDDRTVLPQGWEAMVASPPSGPSAGYLAGERRLESDSETRPQLIH